MAQYIDIDKDGKITVKDLDAARAARGLSPWEIDIAGIAKPGESNYQAITNDYFRGIAQGIDRSVAALPLAKEIGALVNWANAPAQPKPAPGTVAAPQGLSFGAIPGMTPDSTTNYIIGRESAGNPNARNPNSSAAGLGQFIDSTWMDKDLRARAGFANVDDATWKRNKMDPTAQTRMTQAYAARNTEQWTSQMGRAPTPGEVYGMHFLDGPGFIKLTKTAGSNPAADASVMFPAAAAANPTIFYKNGRPRTVGEVYTVLAQGKGAADEQAAFSMPALQQLDPRAMAAAIPLPTAPKSITLEAPPVMGDMPARPQAEQNDTAAILKQLREFAPKGFDDTKAKNARLGEVLSGMAAGAANVDARRGAGAVLAAIGAGGGQAQQQWMERTEAKQEASDEATRLFNLSLARYGIDLNQENKATRGANANAAWQDSRDKLVNTFTNESNAWETRTKQTLLNDQNLRQYEGDLYQAKVLKARVGLQAIESNVNLTNQQLTGQQTLDLKQYLFQDEKSNRPITDQVAQQVTTLLAPLGIDLKIASANKDSVAMNAAQGAAYIANNNPQGAINSLGREMALSGFDIMPDTNPYKKQLLELLRVDPELAAAAAGRLLNEGEATDPGSSLEWARAMAANGKPVGQLFVRHARAQTPAPTVEKK